MQDPSVRVNVCLGMVGLSLVYACREISLQRVLKMFRHQHARYILVSGMCQ